MILETSDWISGKKTRRGQRLPVACETVTVVAGTNRQELEQAVCRFLGCRPDQLIHELRRLRDAGVLIHDPGRLTRRVRFSEPKARYGVERWRCYVFRGRRDEAPVRRCRPQVQVFWWS